MSTLLAFKTKTGSVNEGRQVVIGDVVREKEEKERCKSRPGMRKLRVGSWMALACFACTSAWRMGCFNGRNYETNLSFTNNARASSESRFI
jgi:hypothetical protein